ncbi:MAG: glutathione peroxidase [Blautia sp.]|uniref:Uncharacterized protein n=1 Tax=Fusicatenibacter saccharivorans TaxID=1150298 RepID=A0A174K4N8_9FIRM|nr:hypothetical protein [Fusicatenibacter saccharivorans]CUP05017.1 Uncharacterised protein [Fusicatenibacter saccharivorans]DAQ72179.1 MAG TPA: hypothetical protein [Caudoviricetes sp.]
MGKRNQGNTKYSVTRTVYKAVKKYDHQQFESFCTSVYKCGWEDGRKSLNAMDSGEIEAAIRGVKGIGEVRVRDIMAAINEKFKEKAESAEKEEGAGNENNY